MNYFRCFIFGLALMTYGVILSSCSTPKIAQTPSVPAAPRTYMANVCVELTKCWPTNRTVTIVCHGHSVPAGYFRTPVVQTFSAYPYLLHYGLSERYPHAVINVIVTAIGGENSEQGAKRFQRDVLGLHPDVVTIDYALNDRPIGLARSEKAWREMIEMTLTQNVKVILLTPTPDMKAHLDDPDDPLNQHAEQVRTLAAEYNIGLVDSLALFKAPNQLRYVVGDTNGAGQSSQSERPRNRCTRIIKMVP